MTAVLEQPPVMTPARGRSFTADDLLQHPDSDRFELVNGELVERNMGWRSEWIGTQLVIRIGAHCQKTGQGWVNGSSASYKCFDELFPDDPDRTRKPDVSFIARNRLPWNQFPAGHCNLVPDLAVEVISPNDLYSEVEEKVCEYLRAGVRLVWVVDPRTESVRIHRADGTVSDLRVHDELSGEDVLPGFRCRVNELFHDPLAATSESEPASR